MDTPVQKIQATVVGHAKRMNNSRLPAKALEALVSVQEVGSDVKIRVDRGGWVWGLPYGGCTTSAPV